MTGARIWHPVFIPYLEDQIAGYGLHQRVTAVRAVQPGPGQFNRAFDDDGEYRSVREAFAAAAEPMLGLGVEVIIPAGTSTSRRSACALPPAEAVAELRRAFPAAPP